MDLINRSKAVRKLHEVYDDMQYELVYEDGETLANEVENILASLPQENQWILCSERLPKLSDRFRGNFYLVKLYGVFNDLIEVGYAHFVNRPERTWEIMSEHSEKYWRVISWQKLPESERYKEE